MHRFSSLACASNMNILHCVCMKQGCVKCATADTPNMSFTVQPPSGLLRKAIKNPTHAN